MFSEVRYRVEASKRLLVFAAGYALYPDPASLGIGILVEMECEGLPIKADYDFPEDRLSEIESDSLRSENQNQPQVVSKKTPARANRIMLRRGCCRSISSSPT